MGERRVPIGTPHVVNTEVWKSRQKWHWECCTCRQGSSSTSFMAVRDAAVIHQKVHHTK